MGDETIADAIKENALNPKVMESDEARIEEHPLQDQIDADRYLKGEEAVDASKSRGLRFLKFKAPGA